MELSINCRWQSLKVWIQNVIKTLLKRFRWGFILAGFTALAMAAISWELETSENYWIWHRYDKNHKPLSLSLYTHICINISYLVHKLVFSMWHISIYTSSFLFLCSKAKLVDGEDQRPPAVNYELTRQDSFSTGH